MAEVTLEQVQQALGALYLDLCAARAAVATLEHENRLLRGALQQPPPPAGEDTQPEQGDTAAPDAAPDGDRSAQVNGEPQPGFVSAT